jgi:hypothetical protein
MEFMRRTAGYSSLDHRRNESNLEDLKADPAEEKVAHCEPKLLNHVSRLEMFCTQKTP